MKVYEGLSFSGTNAIYENCNGIQEYFERQVDRTPNAIALEFESSSLTYKELDDRANQVAHFLRKKGVGRDVFVGLLMERSLEMVVCIYGILKAGGAYVPLDPENPQDRLSFLVKDIESPILLSMAHLKDKWPLDCGIPILSLDKNWEAEISKMPGSRLECQSAPESAAYMIYTSGSTGKPKGCVITHKGIANHLQWFRNKFPLKQDDKFLHRTPYTFDASVWEYIWPIIVGASTVLAKPGGHKDPSYQVEVIRRKLITDVQFVPSLLQVFLDEKYVDQCHSLKRVFVGGEALPLEVVRRFYKILPNAKLIDTYGPTETTIACTFWEWRPEDLHPTIGFPTPNNRIYILDEFMNPTSIGTTGEIYIGGVQVGRGYWKRPDLTKERFLRDPFSKDSGARMYRTGDRGRFLIDGTIEYQGRIDLQVKIRGFRIELGEIEAGLIEFPGINQAAVVAKKLQGAEGPLSIVAYYVPKRKTEIPPAELVSFLKLKLPEYMVPSGFVSLAELPIITSGKVDRKDLVERHDDIRPPAARKCSPPINNDERQLVIIWEKVLNISPIGRDDNFFSLGGDSLSLIRVLHELQKHNSNLQLNDLNKHQTVASLGQLIEKRKAGVNPDDLSLPSISPVSQTLRIKNYPLSCYQTFFWRRGSSTNNNNLITLINSLSGPLNVPLFRKCLEKIMERHWVLKTKIVTENEKVFQVIENPEVEYFIEKDIRDLSEEETEESLTNEINKSLEEELNIRKSPSFRFYIYRTAEEQYYVLLKFVHIFFDGLSLNFMRKELKELYSAEMEKRPPLLPETPIQYVDFTMWEEETCIGSEGLERRRVYWKNFLKGLPIFEIPYDDSRKKNLDSPGNGRIERILDINLVDRLAAFSKKQNTTVYGTVLSAFSLCLHQMNSQNEVLFYTIVSLRPKEGENIMGCFMQTLPIRIDFRTKPSRLKLINEIKEQTFSSYANLIPQKQLEELIEAERGAKSIEPVGITFNYLTGSRDTIDLPGIASEFIEFETSGGGITRRIFVVFSVSREKVFFSILFDGKIYSEKSIKKMADIFENLLLEMGDEK